MRLLHWGPSNALAHICGECLLPEDSAAWPTSQVAMCPVVVHLDRDVCLRLSCTVWHRAVQTQSRPRWPAWDARAARCEGPGLLAALYLSGKVLQALTDCVLPSVGAG